MIILYGCPDPATLAPIRVAIFLGQFETSLQFFMSKSYVSEYARAIGLFPSVSIRLIKILGVLSLG